jgi:hypothetical protein
LGNFGRPAIVEKDINFLLGSPDTSVQSVDHICCSWSADCQKKVRLIGVHELQEGSD